MASTLAQKWPNYTHPPVAYDELPLNAVGTGRVPCQGAQLAVVVLCAANTWIVDGGREAAGLLAFRAAACAELKYRRTPTKMQLPRNSLATTY